MTELTWAIVGALATIASIVAAAILGFPALADWIAKARARTDVHALAKLYQPALVDDGYTYLRLDFAVVNKGSSMASNIIIKISSPSGVQTVAEYFNGRQATTPGEGEFNLSNALVEPDGYRTATYLLQAPPLQGESLVSFSAGTAVVYAKDGRYLFRWSARCPEDKGRGTSGTFTVDVMNGVGVLG